MIDPTLRLVAMELRKTELDIRSQTSRADGTVLMTARVQHPEKVDAAFDELRRHIIPVLLRNKFKSAGRGDIRGNTVVWYTADKDEHTEYVADITLTSPELTIMLSVDPKHNSSDDLPPRIRALLNEIL